MYLFDDVMMSLVMIEKTKIKSMELPNLSWNSVDISIMELHSMYIMGLHYVDDGSPQIVRSSITANCRAPWTELWDMDLHKSNDMELHNAISINPIMAAHNSITEIHKSSMEIHNELWKSMINHRALWLCFSILTRNTTACFNDNDE